MKRSKQQQKQHTHTNKQNQKPKQNIKKQPSEILISYPTPASISVLPHPPTPIFSPWHFPILVYQTLSGTRASLSSDVQQVHPLSHMQPEPWVTLCVFFGCWFSLWEMTL